MGDMSSVEGKIHPITYYGTPVLHRECQQVTKFDDELAQLVADMFASMYEANGVGLAANQIGIDASVFVYDCPDATGEHQIGHVVNPTLITPALPVARYLDDEGCLSVPGEHAELERATLAQVTGFDQTGKPITVDGTGLLARCLQHEVDHLLGTVYVDRLSAEERQRVLTAAGLPT